jgi:hypothetical protein
VELVTNYGTTDVRKLFHVMYDNEVIGFVGPSTYSGTSAHINNLDPDEDTPYGLNTLDAVVTNEWRTQMPDDEYDYCYQDDLVKAAQWLVDRQMRAMRVQIRDLKD